MNREPRNEVTDPGDPLAAGSSRTPVELLPVVYEELRGLAGRYLSGERPGHTLQPTALVHEAYLRLGEGGAGAWEGRTHFYAVAASAMKRVLIDHARKRNAAKRGGGQALRITFVDGLREPLDVDVDGILELNQALAKLARLDARQAQIVELRFFGGLTVGDVADHLGVSKRTVEGDWTHARAWLRRELSDAQPP